MPGVRGAPAGAAGAEGRRVLQCLLLSQHIKHFAFVPLDLLTSIGNLVRWGRRTKYTGDIFEQGQRRVSSAGKGTKQCTCEAQFTLD